MIVQRLFDAQYGATFHPFQLANMDSDDNGEINSLDAFYLMRINFKLLRFITGISITPASPGNLCMLNISARALMKGDVPAATSPETNIFFDIETKNVSFRNDLAHHIQMLQGSVAVSNKGAGYNGVVLKAVPSAVGNGVFSVSLSLGSNFQTTDASFGLSVFQATTDALGFSSDVRAIPLIGNMNGGIMGAQQNRLFFPSPLSLTLSAGLGLVTISQSNGYAPLRWFNATNGNLATSFCHVTPNMLPPSGSGQTVTTTTTSSSNGSGTSVVIPVVVSVFVVLAIILGIALFILRVKQQANKPFKAGTKKPKRASFQLHDTMARGRGSKVDWLNPIHEDREQRNVAFDNPVYDRLDRSAEA